MEGVKSRWVQHFYFARRSTVLAVTQRHAVFQLHNELCDVALSLPHAVKCGRFCFWRCRSVFLFVYEISREPQNGFAPNSHERRVWSLARMSLKVKVKGQRSRSPGTEMAFFGIFGGLRAVYVCSGYLLHC